jgi:hypothetical protein
VTPSVEMQTRFRDYAHYHQHLRIQDYASHTIIPLHLNRIQRVIHNKTVELEQAGQPVRLIVLKARREGVSTYVQSRFAHRVFTRRNLHALTVSHEDDSTIKLHAMTERMWENLPAAIRPEKESGIRGKRIVLTHKSSIEVATAGGDGQVARSGGYTHLHFSEVAQYPDAQGTLAGALPTVPDSPGTIVVLESTAKGRTGRGGEFYQRWLAAQSSTGGYTPLFFAWFDFPQYVVDPPRGFTLDETERSLRDRFNLTLPQLAWRRRTIEQDYSTNPVLFMEEFPATAEEAFLSSGRKYFDQLQVMGIPVMEPRFRGELSATGLRPGEKIHLERDSVGRLRVYEVPEKGKSYFGFIDSAGDVKPSEYEAFEDKRDAEDYSCIYVVDLSTGATVAVWHGRIDLDLLGDEAAKLGYLYNEALLCPEMTGGYGRAVAGTLRRIGYRNIERRYRTDNAGQRHLDGYGWDTTTVTRPLMLSNLREVLRDHPSLLRDAGLKAEMESFVIGPTGKPEADVGCHDDVVMAAAGAYQGFARHATRERIQVKRRKRVKSVSQRAVAA